MKATLIFILSSISLTLSTPPSRQTTNSWYIQGERLLEEKIHHKVIAHTAKNVIFFIGDGMGLPTVVASRIYEGQSKGKSGEEHQLSWEKFPNVALSKTYSLNKQVPDSAATATAMLTGIKTNDGVLGLDGNSVLGDCDSAKNTVTSLLQLAEEKGMSTGIVTTARITHATPAAAYAHSADRIWEYAVPPSQAAKGCKDIAVQLLDSYKIGDGFEVVMGGGRRYFLPNTTYDPEYPQLKGHRLDNRNLINEWIDSKLPNAAYVWNLTSFKNVDAQKTDHLLGLFDPDHMKLEALRTATDPAGEPSLTEMTQKAIEILQKNPKGYFLYIESARIDHTHHVGVAAGAITEAVQLASAVEAAVSKTNKSETLTIVTADHGHTMSMSGYPNRGTPILGLSGDMSLDGKPYTTLNYANGPGAWDDGSPRPNVTNADALNLFYRQQALVKLTFETHDGVDVGVYSNGPYAHLLSGVVEQNFIYHVMHHALCLDPHINSPHCSIYSTRGAASHVMDNKLLLTIMILLAIFLQRL